MRSGLQGDFYFSGHITYKVGVSRDEDGFPSMSWAMYAEVGQVRNADRDIHKAFFWNFLIVGLLIIQITGGEGGCVGIFEGVH